MYLTPISKNVKNGLKNKGRKPKHKWLPPTRFSTRVPVVGNCSDRALTPKF